ncbi:MAG TPA: FkbM family methyltransferase [Pontiella sp.]|nr:FkbM family methyltransferase [Pontiella sp.]
MKILQEIKNLNVLFKAHPLWIGKPLKPWFRFIHFQLVSLFHKSPCTFNWVEPLKLVVPQRTGLTGNLYLGLMDFEEMFFLLHFLREDDQFLDVGANVGVYSLLASALTGASSMAIEPVPETFTRLREHVKLNGLEGKIECINQGVGEEAGSLRFSTGSQDCLNHVVPVDSNDDTPSIQIPVTTLDAIHDRTSPAMMKLDIEGYEWHALKGAARLLEDRRLKAIVLEFNLHAERYGVSAQQVEDLLRNAGFSTYAYDPYRRTLNPTPFNTNGNSLWVRKADEVASILKDAKSCSVYGHTL